MSKDDEKVLVVPADVIFAKERWQGMKQENLDYYTDLIKNNYQFKRRGDVENDPSWQQVIPYILFSHENKYFLYKYTSGAGEKRLIDNYIIGVGGHINEVDVNGGGDILEQGMMREWEEEVDFKGKLLDKKLVGVLNDDSRPVESVHMALVYHFIGDSSEISIKEKEKMEGEMVNLHDIWEKVKDNDAVWIKIVYNEYLKGKIQYV